MRTDAGQVAWTDALGHYAGAASRFAAYAVDVVISWAAFTLALAGVSFAIRIVTGRSVSWHTGSSIAVAVVFFAWELTYFGYCWAATGRTAGMALFGLRVVRADGADLDPWRGVVRALVFPLSIILCGLGFAGILVQREHRALHDLLAGTAVVYSWNARATRLRFLARTAGLSTPGPEGGSPAPGEPLPQPRGQAELWPSMAPASRWARRPNKFGLLLLFLIASYLLSAFASGTWVSTVQVALFVGVTALALRTAHVQRRIARLAIIAVTGGSLIVGVLVLADPSTAVQGAANTWKAAVLAFAVVLIVRRVLAQPEVTIQSIYGALSAYMIIGLMFAACYQAMDLFTGGDFFAEGAPGNLQTFQYFSFTTLTTLGYGDFTAGQSGGRAVAVLEAMLGQVFLATLVARLVSVFRTPRRTRADGTRDRRGGQARPARPGGRPRRRGPTTTPGPRPRQR